MTSSARRILILGGYGFFGGRIASLLAKTSGVELILAGRNLNKATAAAYQLGLHANNARVVDAGDPKLASMLTKLGVGVVIHTAGPFQGQKHHVARAAIEARAHYLDLADGRAFVSGIGALDEAARAAGICVISGASSVPALSSAVLDHYVKYFAKLEQVAIGISSGAALPGEATVRGVFGYAGKPFRVWENGAWTQAYGWLDRRSFNFPKPVGPRLLGRCDIPDLELLPQRYPTLKTVSFHGGFASDTCHKMVEWLATQVNKGRIESAEPFARPVYRIARLLEPLLPDRGGMFVRMAGPDDDGRARTLTWQVLASENHGPYIPCAPAIALAQRIARGEAPEPGARACMGMLEVDDILSVLKGFSVREIAPPVPMQV